MWQLWVTSMIGALLDGTTEKGVVKKHVALDCNKNMGGVNRTDSYRWSYQMAHVKLRKYYKIFRYMPDIVCLNAHIIYRKRRGEMSGLTSSWLQLKSLQCMEGHQKWKESSNCCPDCKKVFLSCFASGSAHRAEFVQHATIKRVWVCKEICNSLKNI
jgi:hypothetical protein